LDEWLSRGTLTAGNYFVERCVEDARHIEVQIVADHYGHIIHLGERECSLQRRNQKILEEAPSSALNQSLRAEVGALAISAALSVNYSNVGTIEFLFDKKARKFYFMEINPRVQVEHGITEMITGIDIVRRQLRIAAGEPIITKQEHVEFSGHAIECRINAEDPDNNFIPSPGQIEFYHQPGGPNVRVDSGVGSGSTVPPYYDSLIAKIMVHGRTRGDAIKAMRRALHEYSITGIKTNIDLHRQVLSNPNFCSGNTSTRFISDLLGK
ncbi:MAG: acetyl-CoA carboxylase biotin carboxylase subunit, partial [Negativicutes bacterium]|nr:acetyl-CoA carboxylase biotin carboxylase subunit [Negativicutes bacterium]